MKPLKQTESTCGLLPRREAPRLRTPSPNAGLPRARRREAREVPRDLQATWGASATEPPLIPTYHSLLGTTIKL